MINSAFGQEDRDSMSSCPIALTASSPSSPANDSSRSASSTFNPRTAPNCARCKNHGLKVPLKGHKRYCRYWKCACDKCVQTSTRQKVMARETAHRRARKLHEAKIFEYRKAQERARIMGEKSPEPPMELFNPILSPDTKSSSDLDDDRSASSPGSLAGSGIYPIGVRKMPDKPASVDTESLRIRLDGTVGDESEMHTISEDPSTSDKVDPRSSLRSLQELLLQEHFPLEISSLLYLILKDTPEPKKAFNRIVEAQSELNAIYSKDELGKSHVENWPLYYFTRPVLTPPFPLSHPAFSLAPSYYQPYSTGGTPLSFPAPCRYPYLQTISALKSPDSLFYSPPLTYPEEKKHRLNFDPIQVTKEERSLSANRPSNLCIRESPSGYSLLDSKFSSSVAASVVSEAK